MMLFPITRPRSGLYLSPSRLCVADIRHSFREPQLVEYREHPLPANCIELSASQINISNSDQLLQIMQTLVPEQTRPKSVAICLPDICTRTGVFEFSDLPGKKEELTSLITWRFEKDLNISAATARISFQVYPPQPSGPSITEPRVYRVLATTIQRSIVESYEMLCLKAGLAPMSIGLAGLSVFNLCRTLVDTTISLVSQKVELLPEQRVLIYIADWGFTVLIFQGNSPAFIRIKPIRSETLKPVASSKPADEKKSANGAGSEVQLERQDSQPGNSVPGPNRQQARTIANELIGTMQYYFEDHPTSGQPGSIIPVFLFGSSAPNTVLPEIADIIDKEFPTAGESEEIGIKTFPIIPANGSLPFKTLHGLTSWTGDTLPTFGAAIASS